MPSVRRKQVAPQTLLEEMEAAEEAPLSPLLEETASTEAAREEEEAQLLPRSARDSTMDQAAQYKCRGRLESI